MQRGFSRFEVLTTTLALYLCLAFACVYVEAETIEEELALAAVETLDGAGLYWFAVEANGQTLSVSGAAPDFVAKDAALKALDQVSGVIDYNTELLVLGAAGSCQDDLVAFARERPIRFKNGRDELTDESLADLEDLTELLRTCATRVQIAAHTDNRGDAQINLKLSQRRADAIARQLVRNGVSADVLASTGYGESQPVASNRDELNRGYNERVEFRVVGEPS